MKVNKKIVAREFLLFIIPVIVWGILFIVIAFLIKNKRSDLSSEYYRLHTIVETNDKRGVNTPLQVLKDRNRAYEDILWYGNRHYNLYGDDGYDGAFGILYLIFLIIAYPIRFIVKAIKWSIKTLNTD